MPCPIKIFNLVTGNVICTLSGHTEEILSITLNDFRGKRYIVSTSQDGFIYKHEMVNNYRYITLN
jgi:WD40 repeat protein